MTTIQPKNEVFLKEVSDQAKRDFPQFWNDDSDTNKESRENVIETYYNIRAKTEQLCDEANLQGNVRKMHVFSNLYYSKAEFKMHLMKQEIDLLKAKNAALEVRLSRLSQQKTKKSIPVSSANFK